ncbi:MAG: YggS family pyridoxal phosphate-dependent enzyme [Nanoarchaeota archaeon]|nr:YggS family pyridoxal phosphate-dependent enzyme [Nanoarchaeota archaeon]MCG2717762.1 YggS family pyridoxal phosphate-dependent enzyme [Nanoarchaeota archaeon]
MIKENIANLGIPKNVKLVCVTKTRSVEEIKQAIEYGVKCIGENRIHEAKEKFPLLPEVEKHMIGNLQKNKVKSAVELFDMIQSVNSLKLAKEIDKRSAAIEKVMPILIEVNVADEESKQGITVDNTWKVIKEVLEFQNVKIEGLMCMAPWVKAEETRPYFKKMKELFDSTKLKWLSMGMTNDYKVAIEEGSNMVRVGTAIFGERKY